MMRLDTMSMLMCTIGSLQDSLLLDDILCRWPCDRETVKFTRVSANCVFTFCAEGKGYYLRINHATERTAGAWQAEVAFINMLVGKGLRVAIPVPSFAGNDVESVDASCGELHAVVFTALPGKACDNIAGMPAERITRWGQALGELHRAARGYQAVKDRPTWQDHLALINAFLPTDDAAAQAELARVRHALAELPITEDNFGLIHYDFEPDNIIWDGDRPGIIDFDDCAWYWFAADIAAALGDLFYDRADAVDWQNDAFRAFITGYRQAREIDDEELRRIPLFLRLHNLTTYARLLRTLQAGKQKNEPEWMDALRDKLTRALSRFHANIVCTG